MNAFDKNKKVIYLSSGTMGMQLFDWLVTNPCHIVHSNLEGIKCTVFPDYDIGISFLYPHLIPRSEFLIPHKWVNFHPAPLPEYRGRFLAYYAIMEEAKYFGASIHYMDADYDTGDIIEVIRFPIESHHTAGDLFHLAQNALEKLFKHYIPLLLQGVVNSYPQPDGKYYPVNPIDNYIPLDHEQQKKIRAVTALPRFCATTIIGGRKYHIKPI